MVTHIIDAKNENKLLRSLSYSKVNRREQKGEKITFYLTQTFSCRAKTSQEVKTIFVFKKENISNIDLDQNTMLKRILSFSRPRNGLSAKNEIWENKENEATISTLLPCCFICFTLIP